LGLDQQSWLVQRAALSVLLVCLSGWTHYHLPSKAQSLARERATLEQELALAPLRQRLRRQQAIGFASLARSSVDVLLGRGAQANASTIPDETDDPAADSTDRTVSANPHVSNVLTSGSNGRRSNALRRHGNRRGGARPLGIRTGAVRSRPNAAEMHRSGPIEKRKWRSGS
jgi:hypothetical protein